MTIGLFAPLPHPRDVDDFQLLDRVMHAAAFVTTEEAQLGRDWYPRANECLRYLANELDLPFAGIAASFAVLSTNASFSANVKMFARLLDGDTRIHTRLVVDRATTALQREYILDALAAVDPNRTACKVRSFAWNIYEPSFHAVTLDRWMFRLFGPDYNGDTMLCRYGHDVTTYKRLEFAVIRASECLGLWPSSLQAALWTMLRGSHD